jgi:hypothetical protein
MRKQLPLKYQGPVRNSLEIKGGEHVSSMPNLRGSPGIPMNINANQEYNPHSMSLKKLTPNMAQMSNKNIGGNIMRAQ